MLDVSIILGYLIYCYTFLSKYFFLTFQVLKIASPITTVLSKTPFGTFVSNYSYSIIIMVTNFVIVPLIIDFFTRKEPFHNLSDVDSSILKKLFAFLTFAYILLPLTGYVAISQFIQKIEDNLNQNNFIAFVTKNMGSLTDYYLS